MSVYFPAFILIKPVIKLFSTGCRRVSSRDLLNSLRDGGGRRENWRGMEPRDDVLTTCKALDTHVSQRLRTLFLMFWASFLLQMKWMMSASVEIIFYWAWMIILVWGNEQKWKETTVNLPRVKTSPVDWRVYAWERWVSGKIRKNCVGFSYIFF